MEYNNYRGSAIFIKNIQPASSKSDSELYVEIGFNKSQVTEQNAIEIAEEMVSLAVGSVRAKLSPDSPDIRVRDTGEVRNLEFGLNFYSPKVFEEPNNEQDGTLNDKKSERANCSV